MKSQTQKSSDPLRTTYKDRTSKNKSIPSSEGQKQSKFKPLLFTKVCPDLRCTGCWVDIFETFTVICKDRKHSTSGNMKAEDDGTATLGDQGNTARNVDTYTSQPPDAK